MGDAINPYDPQQLETEFNLALREMAGWPLHTRNNFGARRRHRTVIIYRDHLGRVINSVEQIDEDEYENYSDTWGK